MKKSKELPRAKIIPIKAISKIWLVPTVATFIGVWMIYFHLSTQGPTIEIYFETGEGIEAGKTKIKMRNVDIGTVEDLRLNGKTDGVVVSVRINNNDRNLLKEDTQFWVVRPRIGKGGVSGLGTLLSGAYIELSPGISNNDEDKFNGLESEPVTPAGIPGLHITLDSGSYRAFDVGDPILFHGIEVGRIEYVYFNTEERIVYYNAFIESPYDSLVTTNTKFWEVNGVEVNLSSDGIRVQSGTLETLITGGVTFDVPNDMPRGEIIKERTSFTVFPNEEAIKDYRFNFSLKLILLFSDSIRGLNPGAPVEYKGVKVGKVIRTDTEYPEISNVLGRDSLIPVMVSIEPARIGFDDSEGALPLAERTLKGLLKQGLQGGLATGNLLTGSKFIELKYTDEIMMHPEFQFNDYIVIPTFDSQLDKIISQTSKVMDNLQNLPLNTVVDSANVTLIQATSTLKEFQVSAEQLSALLNQANDKELIASAKDTLDDFRKLSNDFSSGSLTHNELQGALMYLKQALAELEPLLTQLNQKPNSLIFTNHKNKDIEPKGVLQ
jgi:paraquat-inducible protein B